MANHTGRYTTVYDALQRRRSVTTPVGHVLTYSYDSLDRRTQLNTPAGVFTYSYDSNNRLTRLVNPQADRTTIAWDAASRRTVTRLANGTRASFSYDYANQITRLANIKSTGVTISSSDYKYDNAGNRTRITEADGSIITYSYDATYRLTSEHRTGTTPYRNTFSYDPTGNRLVKNETGSRTSYSYDVANQLTTSIDSTGTTTYSFDADGNQQLVVAPDGGRTTTTWDYENKTALVQLPSGVRNTMAYDPDGLRVRLDDSSGTKKTVFDGQAYLLETDDTDTLNVVYTQEPTTYGSLISQRRKSGAIWTPTYYHFNALGSTRELTDASQAITDTYLYDAWGNVLTSSGTTVNPFRYVGQLGYHFDPATGNYYIRARIYSPVTGRWTSTDPLMFVDGMNLYRAYFVPVHVDPSGTEIPIIDFLPPVNPCERCYPSFTKCFGKANQFYIACNVGAVSFTSLRGATCFTLCVKWSGYTRFICQGLCTCAALYNGILSYSFLCPAEFNERVEKCIGQYNSCVDNHTNKQGPNGNDCVGTGKIKIL